MPALTNITIPTPEPYDKQNSAKQQENYYYVYLQLLQVAKTNGEQVSFNPSSSLSVDVAAIVQALQDLQYNGEIIDFGELRIRLEGRVKSLGV
jgi:hypothetical protein